MEKDPLRAHFLLMILMSIICTNSIQEMGDVLTMALGIFYLFALAFCGFLLQPSRRWIKFYVLVTIPPLLITGLEYYGLRHTSLLLIRHFFIMLIHAQMLRAVFTHSLLRADVQVTDRIIAGICGYLILGLGFSNLYMIAWGFSTSAFIGISPAESVNSVQSDLIYFSLVSLTTLGYGDITPLNHLVRLLAAFQAVFGTLYISVFVASLVAELKIRKNS